MVISAWLTQEKRQLFLKQKIKSRSEELRGSKEGKRVRVGYYCRSSKLHKGALPNVRCIHHVCTECVFK